MTHGITWRCGNCGGEVTQAPNSAARALPDVCPYCKRVGATWYTNQLVNFGGGLRLDKRPSHPPPSQTE